MGLGIDFRKLAHLQEQLSAEQFAALIRSDNTGKVKALCERLLAPPTMTIDGRTYEILDFPFETLGFPVQKWDNDGIIKVDVMLCLASAIGANLDGHDGEHILSSRDEIPQEFKGKVTFVFPNWPRQGGFRDDDGRSTITYKENRWTRSWIWIHRNWSGDFRLLRRKGKRNK